MPVAWGPHVQGAAMRGLLDARRLGFRDVDAGEGRLDVITQVGGDLCGGAAGEALGGKPGPHLVHCQMEIGIGDDGVDQRIGLAAGHCFLGLEGQHAETLVQNLAVATAHCGFHQQGLGGHERKLARHACLDRRGDHGQARGDVGREAGDGIGSQEGIGQHQAPVGGIVEATLEPLGGGGQRTVERVGEQSARQPAQPLGAHGIALVGHGRGADLVAVERLGQLADTHQQTNVAAEFVRALGDAGKRREYLAVLLSRVGLAGDREGQLESELLGDRTIEGFDFTVVAAEERQVAGLGACRALGATTAQVVATVCHLAQILEELLQPQAGPLADGGELGGLEVRVSQARRVAVAGGEGRQIAHHRCQPAGEQIERFSDDQGVGVVDHEHAGRAQVQDAASALRIRLAAAGDVVGQLGEVAKMGDHVVAGRALDAGDAVEVDGVFHLLEGFDLLVADVEPQTLLGTGERDPQPAPGAEAVAGREQTPHLVRGVALVKRVLGLVRARIHGVVRGGIHVGGLRHDSGSLGIPLRANVGRPDVSTSRRPLAVATGASPFRDTLGPVMTFQVFSETGPLRRVLIHRPGREIDWMVPSMMERLLFDDILDGEEARAEHDAFRGVLEAAGVETLDPQDLVATALENPDARTSLLDRLTASGEVDPALAEELATLEPRALATSLIAGVRHPSSHQVGTAHAPPQARGMRGFYRLPPIPNYFFQRDPQTVLGDRVLISSMATEARSREPLIAETAFRHALGGADALISLPVTPGQPEPMVEGGDVLVASPEVLLVGLSERTNRWGVEALVHGLRAAGTSFRHLVVVELPAQRSYMHLDTVFTFIDEGTCLAYLPVIAPGGSEAGHVYSIDLAARDLAYRLAKDLPAALDELGISIELVACGGDESIIDQQREQWTDGANAFAIAPGVIVIYRRNRRTLDTLARRGWRILTEDDVLVRNEPVLGAGPTAIALLGNELARARGGPRCMTMPLARTLPGG